MPFNQTKDVFEQARKFHHKLSEFYENLKDSAERERTRALLDYLSRHEQYLESCLEEFMQDVSRNVADSFLQYGPDASTLKAISSFQIKSSMEVEDVVAAAMHFDACLIKFYREMAEKTQNSKVREVFENLLIMEEHEQMELSKTTMELGLLDEKLVLEETI
ncbi:ferritin family protein [Pontiella agarivorans]|uniref:Ferritin family protein n=1 Tax=Pontiella agarivorans TaxID=3038953 RepID=A0ABU5MWV1_9BACT|nr:ferritin family protein [Pontiella agarivorans]MDZ8118622.1 ferritin family protein [Pontiella agarivorans]